VKILFHSLLIAVLSIPLILAQTSQSFVESFDSGNGEGWAFYTDASVSVQNGQLNVVSSGTDFQIAHVYPPIGATVNDFSIEIISDATSIADGGFLGRNGFNSLIGLLFDDDTVNVVYAINITDYMNPQFVTIGSIRLDEFSVKPKLSIQKSGNSINVNAWINDTLKYSGTIQNAPQQLLKGNLILSVVGESLDFRLDQIDIQYNPYIQPFSSTYNDSFDDPSTPFLRIGTWEKVASAVTINNGNLNFNIIPTSSSSLYAGLPLGAVDNYDITLTGSGHMADGLFGIWRINSYRYYTGMWIEDDLIKVGYSAGSSGEPVAVNSAPVTPQATNLLRFATTVVGNTITMTVYVNNVLHLTGSFDSPDTRLHSGHIIFGVEAWDTVNMAFSEISIVFNKYITDIEEENLPKEFSLFQNFPNPFNPETVIEYELAKGSDVKVEVFDILGRKCLTLVEQYQPIGKHRVSFDGLELSGGVYFYRLTADGFVQTRKMVLLK
jgi:hypothetical protein